MHNEGASTEASAIPSHGIDVTLIRIRAKYGVTPCAKRKYPSKIIRRLECASRVVSRHAYLANSFRSLRASSDGCENKNAKKAGSSSHRLRRLRQPRRIRGRMRRHARHRRKENRTNSEYMHTKRRARAHVYRFERSQACLANPLFKPRIFRHARRH